MTTIQAGFPNLLSVDMADDNVELSGIGERVGDDDIDIDIDLSPGHNDEDYILEDVPPDAGLDEAIVSNEDLMIDEENISYPMDDVDLVQEENANNLQMEDADLTEMPASDFISTELNGNHGMSSSLFTSHVTGTSETTMDNPHGLDTALRDAEEKQVTQGQPYFNDTEFAGKSMLLQRSTLSPPTSPAKYNGTLEGPQRKASLSQAESTRLNTTASGKQDSTDTVVDSNVATLVAQEHRDAERESDRDDDEIHTAIRVIVIYRDAEYALISTSDSDDPDSFFLEDGELTKRPLVEFLTALRNVVLDDLAPDDELCIAIEDLGLEISETSMSMQQVTFADIVDLYDTLLRNDGVETPGPLYVTLGTKPEFGKRLASLVTGAADGKGLSELVSWDEESESLEDVDESVQHENTIKEPAGSNGHHEPATVPTVAIESESTHRATTEDFVPEDVASEQFSPKNVDDVQLLEDNEEAHDTEDALQPTASGHASTLPEERGDLRADGHDSGSRPTGVAYPSNDEVDEDGDLIDYEDEEYEQARDANVSPNSEHQVDRSSTQDAINEELRRRSISLAAEQERSQSLPRAQHDGSIDKSSPDHGTAIYIDHATDEISEHETDSSEDEDFTGYDQYVAHESSSGVDSDPENESGAVDSHEILASLDEVTPDNEPQNGTLVAQTAATNSEEVFDTEGLVDESEYIDAVDDDLEDDLEDEIDYDSRVQDSEDSRLADHAIASDVDDQNLETTTASIEDANTQEISYEEAGAQETAESERTPIADEPAQVLEGDGIEQIHNDEIDYEDDDHQDLTTPSDLKVPIETLPISNGHSGKRPRVEAEDATYRGSKQTKRPRS